MNKLKTNLVVAAAFAVLAIIGTIMNSELATAQPPETRDGLAATQSGAWKANAKAGAASVKKRPGAIEAVADEDAAACGDGYLTAAQGGGCGRDRKTGVCLTENAPCGSKGFCTTVGAKHGPTPYTCKCL